MGNIICLEDFKEESIPEKKFVKIEKVLMKNSRKKCQWEDIVNVILIPSRKEYYDVGLDSILWWKDDDYIDFKNEFSFELCKYSNIIKKHIRNYIKKKMIIDCDSSESSIISDVTTDIEIDSISS